MSKTNIVWLELDKEKIKKLEFLKENTSKTFIREFCTNILKAGKISEKQNSILSHAYATYRPNDISLKSYRTYHGDTDGKGNYAGDFLDDPY